MGYAQFLRADTCLSPFEVQMNVMVHTVNHITYYDILSIDISAYYFLIIIFIDWRIDGYHWFQNGAKMIPKQDPKYARFTLFVFYHLETITDSNAMHIFQWILKLI